MNQAIGIISDMHGDVERLQQAIDACRERQCARIICLGDIVEGELFDEETIDLLQREKLECIRGNHDNWAIADGGVSLGLSKNAVRFLKALPSSLHVHFGTRRIAFWHARPNNDMQGIDPRDLTIGAAVALLDEAKADLLLVGHTHVAFNATLDGGRKLMNPGALWRGPRVENVASSVSYSGFGLLTLPDASFEVFDAASGEATKLVSKHLSNVQG